MELAKKFYIVAFKDGSVKKLDKLTDIIRIDVKRIFKATYLRSTRYYKFYEFVVIGIKGKAFKDNSFLFDGIRCTLVMKEAWRTFDTKKNYGVVLTVTITDRLSRSIEKRFRNGKTKLEAFTSLFKYIELLNRVGSHQGAIEILELNTEVKSLSNKLELARKTV